jgi:hypothetical protein
MINLNNNCPVFILKPACAGFFYAVYSFMTGSIINNAGEIGSIIVTDMVNAV